MLVVKFHSTGNSFGKGESRSLGLDGVQFVPLVSSDMLGHQGVSGLDDGEAAGGDVTARSHAASLGLECGDHLQGVVDDLLGGKAAGDHVSGGATVINDHKSLPGNALLSIKHSILLANFSRSVSQKWDLTFPLQTTISPRKRSYLDFLPISSKALGM